MYQYFYITSIKKDHPNIYVVYLYAFYTWYMYNVHCSSILNDFEKRFISFR